MTHTHTHPGVIRLPLSLDLELVSHGVLTHTGLGSSGPSLPYPEDMAISIFHHTHTFGGQETRQVHECHVTKYFHHYTELLQVNQQIVVYLFYSPIKDKPSPRKRHLLADRRLSKPHSQVSPQPNWQRGWSQLSSTRIQILGRLYRERRFPSFTFECFIRSAIMMDKSC